MKTRIFSLGVALSLLAIPSPTAQASTIVADDFSDGDDTLNPTWSHDWKLANSTGQSWTVAGGVYRLQAPNNGYQTYGYVGSLVGPVCNDVNVSADMVSFINNSGIGGVFGVMARVTSPAGGGGFNNMTGYAYAYEPFADSFRGEMVLYRISGLSLSDKGSYKVTLDPNKDYRFALDVTGNTVHGWVYEIGGGLVAEKVYVDPTPFASGRSGVFGYSASSIGPATDFSVDNFQVIIPEPASTALLALALAALIACRRAGCGA